MSVLPPEVHAALDSLLQGLQSTDNTARSQAEEQLNTEWAQARPDVLLMGLGEQLQASDNPAVRQPFVFLLAASRVAQCRYVYQWARLVC